MPCHAAHEIVRQATILAGRPVILGTDLGSAESRTSLHVAMLALDASRSGR